MRIKGFIVTETENALLLANERPSPSRGESGTFRKWFPKSVMIQTSKKGQPDTHLREIHATLENWFVRKCLPELEQFTEL